jgi:hypothetical protein
VRRKRATATASVTAIFTLFFITPPGRAH